MFILPALYILNIEDVSFLEMAIPIVLGGVLGVFLATVFRRYFCEEMDGVYPFPSGSAAAEVLESDEGSKAHIMLVSGAVALVYDFVLNSLGWWQELLTTTTFHWGQVLADKYKLVFSLDNDAALLGIGYFTGLRYAAIIAAGSFFSWLVCIPVAYYLGGDHTMVVGGETMLLANAPVDAVFSQYVRHIGIGMLAMSGIIGLLSMSGVDDADRLRQPAHDHPVCRLLPCDVRREPDADRHRVCARHALCADALGCRHQLDCLHGQ